MRSLSHSFVSLAFVLAAVHAGPIRKRAEGDPMGVQDGGEATFYDIGLGACGVTNSGDDLMAAVSHSFFDTYPGYDGGNPNANPMCGKTATVTYNGKTVKVQLLDRCESCQYIDLDLSPAAFSQLASFDEGRIHGISWQIDGDGTPAPPPETSAPPPPSQTSAPPPPETSAPPPPPETSAPPPPPETSAPSPPETTSTPTPTEDPCPGETETAAPPPPTATEDPCPGETETAAPPPPPPTSTEDPCPGETTTLPPTTGSSSCPDTYDNSKVYVGGDAADYQGHHWKAQWWTQGAAPGVDAVWQDAGAC